MGKIEFLRSQDLDAITVRKLLIEQRDDAVKRKKFMQEKHDMIRFQASRGMSRMAMIRTWGAEMVAEALDSDGVQTLVAAG
jgi:peptide subunit release factor 1 (eRF1)